MHCRAPAGAWGSIYVRMRVLRVRQMAENSLRRAAHAFGRRRAGLQPMGDPRSLLCAEGPDAHALQVRRVRDEYEKEEVSFLFPFFSFL